MEADGVFSGAEIMGFVGALKASKRTNAQGATPP
jgi:hypothetical protein